MHSWLALAPATALGASVLLLSVFCLCALLLCVAPVLPLYAPFRPLRSSLSLPSRSCRLAPLSLARRSLDGGSACWGMRGDDAGVAGGRTARENEPWERGAWLPFSLQAPASAELSVARWPQWHGACACVHLSSLCCLCRRPSLCVALCARAGEGGGRLGGARRAARTAAAPHAGGADCAAAARQGWFTCSRPEPARVCVRPCLGPLRTHPVASLGLPSFPCFVFALTSTPGSPRHRCEASPRQVTGHCCLKRRRERHGVWTGHRVSHGPYLTTLADFLLELHRHAPRLLRATHTAGVPT